MGGQHTIYLVDASPYIFRAYFSLPSTMVDREEQPVGAVYGFTAFLLKLIDDEEPTHLGVAFDESLTTSFRNEIFPDYKAQRELPPPELEAQLVYCQEVTRALGGAVYVDQSFEADDLIGTLARQLETKGHRSVVITSDKDLAQLVTEKVTLFDWAKGTRYTPQQVEEKFSVRPEQIADFLGLAGDSVDNIPGVKGVGVKTATALLGVFRNIEELYERLDEVSELPLRGARSLRGKLEAGKDQAFLSKQLATIALDAPVRAELDELELQGADPTLIEPLFDRLGFEGIRQRITRWG